MFVTRNEPPAPFPDQGDAHRQEQERDGGHNDRCPEHAPMFLPEDARVGRGREGAQLLFHRLGHVERLDECGDRLVRDMSVGASAS